MIERLREREEESATFGADINEITKKVNEIIGVVNAITDGAENFNIGMERRDFLSKVLENLRTAQNKKVEV